MNYGSCKTLKYIDVKSLFSNQVTFESSNFFFTIQYNSNYWLYAMMSTDYFKLHIYNESVISRLHLNDDSKLPYITN